MPCDQCSGNMVVEVVVMVVVVVVAVVVVVLLLLVVVVMVMVLVVVVVHCRKLIRTLSWIIGGLFGWCLAPACR